MIKAVVFDLNGVLVPDAYKMEIEAQKKWLPPEKSELFRQVEDDATRGKIGRSQLMAKYGEIFGNNFLDELDWRMEKIIAVPDEQLTDLIKKLQNKYKTALLSNIFSFWASILKKQDYLRLFNSVILSSDVGLAKPEKAIYELCAQRLGIHVEEMVFVDDRQENIDGAKAAGVVTGILYINFADLVSKLKEVGVTA